ncbi:MAG: glycerate kinase [Microbacterium sp.]|uniref:glycerate kinase n=1 Tax=Microbacterium sp. TaxID=51671 RepID=UPI0039E67F42
MSARRVVLAPDSFKGSIAAAEAASALAAGWHDADPDADLVLRPMADGGEGTLDAFAVAVPGARRIRVAVPPPAGTGPGIDAEWLLLPPTPDAPAGTGVVELAATCGIELFGDARDPWHASTEGFGVAIAAALDAGVSRLVLAIGSSASTDGGAGMLRALGGRFTGDDGARGAAHLAAVDAVDPTGLRPLPPAGAVVLTDVTNPLLGPRGAAAVFGPQKGFSPDEIADVDAALARYAALFDVDPETPGAGAAGGTGFALLAWGARLVPGASEVARLVGLSEVVATASVVVTGEGAYDGQSAAGKAPAHAAALAADAGVPAALVAGRIDPGADTAAFAASVSLTELAGSPEAALAEPARWLRVASAELAARLR